MPIRYNLTESKNYMKQNEAIGYFAVRFGDDDKIAELYGKVMVNGFSTPIVVTKHEIVQRKLEKIKNHSPESRAQLETKEIMDIANNPNHDVAAKDLFDQQYAPPQI